MHDALRPLAQSIGGLVRIWSEKPRLAHGTTNGAGVPARISKPARNIEGHDAGPKINRCFDRKIYK
jgi:hypothetical protein